MSDPSTEQWREAVGQSTGARLRAALEANEGLAREVERLRREITIAVAAKHLVRKQAAEINAENERLRAEVEGLRHRIAGRTGTHILTEKGLAAIQATDPKRPS